MAVLPVACSYARPAGETRGEWNGERRRAYYSCMVAGRGACSATCAVRVVAVCMVSERGTLLYVRRSPHEKRARASTMSNVGRQTLLADADVICAMKAARSYVNVYAINRKAATNEEVHEHLFGTKPAGELHAALADVKVTAKCFVEMEKRNWM